MSNITNPRLKLAVADTKTSQPGSVRFESSDRRARRRRRRVRDLRSIGLKAG
jgi:hypothetical protein